MTALRLLTKDLLILFTCVNEGMINILGKQLLTLPFSPSLLLQTKLTPQSFSIPLAEHYFEMSHSDATTALKIYKTFCRDTEKVVAYLGIAKKLYNVLNVPIPNLKHVRITLSLSLAHNRR